MVDTDEVGQVKLDSVVEALDTFEWTAWDEQFIYTAKAKKLYSKLTSRQKAAITRLHKKMTSQKTPD